MDTPFDERKRKMIKKILFWLPFFAAFFISYGTLYYDYKTYHSDNVIYIPLQKGKVIIEDNRFLLRFKPIIPLTETSPYRGKAVVYINSFKVASFVRFPEKKETLSFGEQFLNYEVYRKPGLDYAPPVLYFAQRYFDIPKNWRAEDLSILERARYAAFMTDKKTGKAVFLTLVDRNFAQIKPHNLR